MTEAESRANILDPNKYPQILDNTLNFAIPCDDETQEKLMINKMRIAFEEMKCDNLFSEFMIFLLQHHYNGKFLIFQVNL